MVVDLDTLIYVRGGKFSKCQTTFVREKIKLLSKSISWSLKPK